MGLMSVGEASINVARAGPRSSPPLLFLHPFGLDSTWWGAQVEEFGRDYDVIAMDLPGHGLSERLKVAPSFDVLSDIIENALIKMGVGAAHVVGISLGGMIAQTLVSRHPELVRSLTLVATLCSFSEQGRIALRERARVARTHGMARIAELSNERWFPRAFRERRPDMLDRTTRSLLLQDADFHGAVWDMIAGLELAAQLPGITCPSLVVAGAEDGSAPPMAGERIAGLIPGASLAVIPGVGHFPPFETPDAFNALLRSFLVCQAH